MVEINSLSYSKVASLLRCPRAFAFHYIQQIPTPIPARMILGRVDHHCLATAEMKKQLFNEVIGAEEIADTFSRQWERELADKLIYDELGEEKAEATIIDFGEEKPEDLKGSGIKLAQLYVVKVLPGLEIVSIEKRLVADVDGVAYVGYPDLVLANDVVIDHKLMRRKMSEGDVEKDIQASSYALLLDREIGFEFHMALDTKEKRVEIARTRREKGDIEWLKVLIGDAWRQIISGILPPNPTGWWCSPDCPYWLECRKEWF